MKENQGIDCTYKEEEIFKRTFITEFLGEFFESMYSGVGGEVVYQPFLNLD